MRFLVLLSLVCFLVSCKAQKSPAGEEMEGLVLVDSDGYSGIMDYGILVIRDTKSLHKFYAQVNRIRKPGLPVPMLDFSKETAIVVCMGEQQGEQKPLLSKTAETEEELSLAIALLESQRTEKEEENAISTPFYLYKIPQTSKKIDLKKVGW